MKHSFAVVGAAIVGLMASAPVVQAQPFNQCPAVGADASCSILFTIGSGGGVTTVTDHTQQAYDGVEDALIGVQNNSNQTVSVLHLSSSFVPGVPPMFGFDGDGLCSFQFLNCNNGPTGYEGPNTFFSNISLSQLSGDVNFTGGLAPGASAYFSLEGSPDNINSGGITGGTTTPEPSSMALLGTGLVGLVPMIRRKKNS